MQLCSCEVCAAPLVSGLGCLSSGGHWCALLPVETVQHDQMLRNLPHFGCYIGALQLAVALFAAAVYDVRVGVRLAAWSYDSYVSVSHLTSPTLGARLRREERRRRTRLLHSFCDCHFSSRHGRAAPSHCIAGTWRWLVSANRPSQTCPLPLPQIANRQSLPH